MPVVHDQRWDAPCTLHIYGRLQLRHRGNVRRYSQRHDIDPALPVRGPRAPLASAPLPPILLPLSAYAAPPTQPYAGDGPVKWGLAAASEDCDTYCISLGKTCKVSKFGNIHKGTYVADVIARDAGVSCSAFPEDTSTTPPYASFEISSGECKWKKSGGAGGDCGTDLGANERRFCPCELGSPTPPPPTPPPSSPRSLVNAVAVYSLYESTGGADWQDASGNMYNNGWPGSAAAASDPANDPCLGKSGNNVQGHWDGVGCYDGHIRSLCVSPPPPLPRAPSPPSFLLPRPLAPPPRRLRHRPDPRPHRGGQE